MSETNAARLERIKRHWNSDIQEEWDCVNGVEITWLIEQAEYVQDLENETKQLREKIDWMYHIRKNVANAQAERVQEMKKEFANDIDFKRREVHGLQEENKRLREELEESNRIKDVMDGHLVRTGQKIIDREKAWAESQYQLRETLGFYADETKYEKIENCDGETEIYIECDRGEKARQMLEQLK